uniref:Cobalt ion transporter n=1 Tax=Rhizophora mucronata TaxID=61149 RepID=A0A2P2MPV7_RHIMU
MNYTHRIIPTFTFPSPQNPNFARVYCNSIVSNPIAIHFFNEPPKCILKLRSFKIRASANSNDNTGNWVGRLPTGAFGADKILRLIAGATACPIGQFISSPTTFLHSVDPRVKLVWLLALVVLPARSHIVMRFGLVVFIAFLSMWILPKYVWMDQLGRVSLLSGILFIMLGLGSDGAPPLVQLRTPPPAMMGLPKLPVSLGGYSYLIMKLGPLQFTRKGLSVASTAASLTFIVS